MTLELQEHIININSMEGEADVMFIHNMRKLHKEVKDPLEIIVWRDIYTYYVLTAICDILGIDKNNELYQEFVALIQLVRSDASMEKEAVAYNAFGPMIATSLYQDPNGVELCKNLLTTYLAKAFIAIKENRQEDAIRIYEDMVKFLFVRYRNVEDFSNIIDQNQFPNPKVMIKK